MSGQVMVALSPALFTLPTDRARAAIAPAACCLCGDDDGEPIAVGRDFAHPASRESFLVLQCQHCGVAYLARQDTNTSAASVASSERSLPAAARTALASIVNTLPHGARVLEVGCAGGTRLRELALPVGCEVEGTECDPSLALDAERNGIIVHRGVVGDLAELAPYDLVIFAGSLGAHADPIAALTAAAGRLRRSGRIVILASNVASRGFRLFGGRHWVGYEFPRVRHWFDAAALARVIERAGLVTERVEGANDDDASRASLTHLLVDWGAPPWLVARFAPTATVLPALLRVVGALRLSTRRCGLLIADCRLVGTG